MGICLINIVTGRVSFPLKTSLYFDESVRTSRETLKVPSEILYDGVLSYKIRMDKDGRK